MTRFAVGLRLVLVTTTTVVAADREHEQLMADIRMLHEHTMRLHLTINGIVEAMETLSANQEALGTAMRRAFADQRLTIDNVGSTTRVLREKLDETKEELFNLRFQLAVSQSNDTASFGRLRRQIARIRTVMHEAALEEVRRND